MPTSEWQDVADKIWGGLRPIAHPEKKKREQPSPESQRISQFARKAAIAGVAVLVAVMMVALISASIPVYERPCEDMGNWTRNSIPVRCVEYWEDRPR